MKVTLKTSKVAATPEAKIQRPETFYTLVVDGAEVCGNRASAFYGIRDAAFSLACSAAIVLDRDIDGRDVEYKS